MSPPTAMAQCLPLWENPMSCLIWGCPQTDHCREDDQGPNSDGPPSWSAVSLLEETCVPEPRVVQSPQRAAPRHCASICPVPACLTSQLVPWSCSKSAPPPPYPASLLTPTGRLTRAPPIPFFLFSKLPGRCFLFLF